MPKIPESAVSKGSNFLKPDSFLNPEGKPYLNFGDKIQFIITGAHVETKQKDGSLSYSIPVKTKDGKTSGSFSINKTNMKMFVDNLGDNSDTWPDSEFTGMVMPVRNPQTNAQVKGWSIIKETIKLAQTVRAKGK